MFVEDVMTRRPPICYRRQQLVAAARLLNHSDVAGIPVLSSDFRLVGILSVEDLVRWEARRDSSRGWIQTLERQVLVAHVMTHDVIGVSPRESIADAARVMRYESMSVLPVVALDGSLAGVVSAKDIASVSARDDASIRLEIHDRLATHDSSIAPGAINVHVEDGRVTLTGVVNSYRDLQAVRRRVSAVSGVAGIHTEPLARLDATIEATR